MTSVTYVFSFKRYQRSHQEIQETAMATLVKPTQSRFVRWFKQIRKNNKAPYKWYECDKCGI